MKRKVARIGPSTLMISLPSKWVKHYHVAKGDELDVTIKGPTLTIAVEAAHKGNYGTVTIAHPELIRRYLNSLYRQGYDEATITCPAGINVATITQELSELLGFELIDHGKNHFTVRIVSESIDNEFDHIFNRVFLVNISLGRECLDAITTKDHQRLKQASIMEKTTNKLANLCLRILNKKGHDKPEKTTTLYSLVMSLERIADCYRDICQSIIRKKPFTVSKNTTRFFKETNDFLATIYRTKNAFRDAMPNVKKERQHLTETYYDLLEKTTKDEVTLIVHLFNIIQELAGMEFILLDLSL